MMAFLNRDLEPDDSRPEAHKSQLQASTQSQLRKAGIGEHTALRGREGSGERRGDEEARDSKCCADTLDSRRHLDEAPLFCGQDRLLLCLQHPSQPQRWAMLDQMQPLVLAPLLLHPPGLGCFINPELAFPPSRLKRRTWKLRRA